MNDATRFPFQLTDSPPAALEPGPIVQSHGELPVIYATEVVSVDQLIAALNIAGAELELARSSANTARSRETAALSAVNTLQGRLERALELVRAAQPRGTDWQVRGLVLKS